MRITTLDATLPPAGLPGLDPALSRLVEVAGAAADTGRTRTWHVLDTGDALAARGIRPVGTIVAVHGNPTWSYLWRALVNASLQRATAGGAAWRVVAVDQLEMGFSDRTSLRRTLAQRIADLDALVGELGIPGPVVTIGHDWGGPVSLGWAVENRDRLAAVIALNTAVHHPDGAPLPVALRVATARGMLAAGTTGTTAFLDTTLALAELDPAVREAFRAPYATVRRRRGIGGFVADIPATSADESTPALRRMSAGLRDLDVPALFLRGPKDPVFGEGHLDDLTERLPHADVHRFEGAGHLIAEERPYAEVVLDWLDEKVVDAATPGATTGPAPSPTPPADGAAPAARTTGHLWDALDARRDDDDIAVIDMSTARDGEPLRVSWRQLAARVDEVAAGLDAFGVRAGDRVSLLVQPGPTLTAALYACLRIGAVVVVADRGLGIRGLSRAVRGAVPDIVIGEVAGLVAARALGWPGRRISAAALPAATSRALGVEASLSDLARAGRGRTLPAPPAPEADAAVLFTSGSTGPAKGVVYTHAQLTALRDTLAAHFGVTADTGLVTGFAPFALLGPALGTRSATPDMDVSAPRTLTAAAVAAAVRASDARMVFLSPAAVANVVATSAALDDDDRAALERVETFLSTGAPVGVDLLRRAQALMPNAVAHTPYGMTECLLVADVTLPEIEEAAGDRGVCVGRPLGTGQVRISAIDADGRAAGEPTTDAGVTGEIVISAPHLKRGYFRLYLTDREARRGLPERWHRTGDVGHLDAHGRLWVEGRLPHVITTAEGPVTPVGIEQDAETVDAVSRAAAVGVGPVGRQVVVAVVEAGTRRPGLASPSLADDVRAATRQRLAAVLTVPVLPTDIRHNSKIDRSRVAAWAERLLSGEKPTAP
ncbi:MULTISPECIES: alpha/beta fold hydrolase [Microbacterium]|uniref:alpha/beta fold hydrolase n=1 Tax=Microbacterium TaxID=33882 RepID=UPI002785A00F|nr:MULTISPECIES: alpha/beta fold hydrolase [Microbacterium]MDQ1083290.1 acyl-CoA synthetase (AMP-forming)/AMP-acid ligase II/pimeloyl-ACP methyl ester carboxylesterase [Microbacterium sp. SORGH_AS_0344]MDQ1171432.1 acyl-CoA synthetase (AMP-forming)/AMP-acid ligase II/pimeloyl-ACP methyl ester carboxylesterase [Microbacterium proteolyticum]